MFPQVTTMSSAWARARSLVERCAVPFSMRRELNALIAEAILRKEHVDESRVREMIEDRQRLA